jgi:hypothetical protein
MAACVGGETGRLKGEGPRGVEALGRGGLLSYGSDGSPPGVRAVARFA